MIYEFSGIGVSRWIHCNYTTKSICEDHEGIFFDNFVAVNPMNIMIQRIQSVYLLLSAIVMSAGIFLSPLFMVNGEAIVLSSSGFYVALAGGAAGISLANIFAYRNRRSQVVLNRLNIIASFVLSGFIVVDFINQPEGAIVEVGLGMMMPLINVILLVLANRGIMKDEMLVKAADRLR
ncbi:MAG: DUF4293 family protein [Bacteroidetes bacterium]|nr:MAG: DUF4293 family protein [Bacteroidota bacterium]